MDERMRSFNEWADGEDMKYIAAGEEIKASMRARVDQMIARLEEQASHRLPVPARIETDSANGTHNGVARHPDHLEATSFGS